MLCNNPKCAREIPEGALFCPWCGRKQAKPAKKTKSRGNGLGTVYKLRSGKWAAVKTVGWIIDPLPPGSPEGTMPHRRRQTVSKQFSTRKDALAALPFLSAADRKPRQGTATQRKKTAVTLKELFDQWYPTHDRGKSTMNCYRAGFRLFAPLWNVPMTDLDIEDLQDCLDDASCGRRTKENARTALGLVYKYGIPRDAVPKDRNLAPFLRIRDAAGEKKEGLSAAELELVRKRAAEGDPVAGMVLCQCYLGFRPTELLSLKKADYNAQEMAFVGGIKTAAGIDRTVTVSPKIRAYVEAALAVCGDGYVFGRQGRQLRPEQYRELFYLLLEDLGIPNPVDDQNRHRLTPHSCRHTFATLMKKASGSDADKLALIGHTSTEQLRDYQDVRFADLRAITDQI